MRPLTTVDAACGVAVTVVVVAYVCTKDTNAANSPTSKPEYNRMGGSVRMTERREAVRSENLKSCSVKKKLPKRYSVTVMWFGVRG